MGSLNKFQMITKNTEFVLWPQSNYTGNHNPQKVEDSCVYGN